MDALRDRLKGTAEDGTKVSPQTKRVRRGGRGPARIPSPASRRMGRRHPRERAARPHTPDMRLIAPSCPSPPAPLFLPPRRRYSSRALHRSLALHPTIPVPAIAQLARSPAESRSTRPAGGFRPPSEKLASALRSPIRIDDSGAGARPAGFSRRRP